MIKNMINKKNNNIINNIKLIEVPEEINKIGVKEKYSYIFNTLKKNSNFKKYIIVNGLVTKVEENKIHLILQDPEFYERKAICLKENFGDMSIKDIEFIFRLGSKHKFVIIPDTEKKEIIYVNYKSIHPEVNLSSIKVTPTLSHYWNIKAILIKKIQKNKEDKNEKNSNNSW